MKHNLMMKYSFISTLLVAVALCLLVLPCDRVNAGPPDPTPSLAMDIRTRLQPYQTPDAEPSRYDGRLLKEAPLPPEVEEPPIGSLAQQTFYAVADATVLQGYPTLNFWGTMDMWAGPEPGHYTGTPSVSFDVTADQQVCNFDITVPFSDDTCRIRPDDCAEIVNNEFTFVKDHPVFVDPYYRITGTFDTQTHALGDYAVWECNYQRFVTPFEGTWEASGNKPPTISGLPDQTLPVNGSADNAIDLWDYADDAESPDSDLTFTIDNTPDPNAGVSIDSNRYIDINPTPGWIGQTNVIICVTDPGGLSDTDTFQVTVLVLPVITSITPNSGYNDEVVHITDLAGANFQAGATVKLTRAGGAGIISATNIVVVSATQITCDFDLTGAATGAWDVVVTNPDSQSGTLPNGFTINLSSAPPAIDSITPNSGNNNEVVHITNLAGSDFQSGAMVRLIKTGQSDIVAINPVVVMSTSITCDFDLRGAYPGQWTVRVTNPDTQYAELYNGFTVKGLVFLPIVLRNP